MVNANWGEATQAIQTYDAMTKSPSGYSVQLTYVLIANCQTEIMMLFASECGFTPASPKPDQSTRLGLAVTFDRTSMCEKQAGNFVLMLEVKGEYFEG